MRLVYFSSRSGNTHRFVGKLGLEATRLPIDEEADTVKVTEPYVLVVPTYGGGHVGKAVPVPVIRFLNDPDNRALIRGVISAGNTNFGEAYCLAGTIVAAKCHVPHLDRFELLGTPEDVARICERLRHL